MGLGPIIGAGAVGGGVAAPVQPAQDPTIAAYLRALGFDDANAQAQANKQISDVNAQTMFQQPEIDYQGDLARQQVDQDALGRGVYSSGERLMGEARAAHAQQFATGRLQLNATQSIGDAQLALARALAMNEGQRGVRLATAAASGAGGGVPYDYSSWG